ncbi:bifunctional UDP-N-acetylmuramoyl-tripeptide:D-alanyl-D-alanine ligase/alanine racemase [Chryseosolibacter indicus]|uniref:Alanine racemase n=1 Tax=Chryseosolibacter indicus TaxID=2782351 RepID=A0ABS5VS14_9BACT|nr:bifunctional UDP-N-acetylmuramoyl-tripeptide:D-alanyl-D-alanine ligase/alanine racemase [Chryseosolibacter indicus]MBT1704207.1 bifunctional UDP-N-acetylmuramoyl-tripeptide:D-alanyl-D-alanine ligase/alanine racemase [Chryseosolibacter indicus]
MIWFSDLPALTNGSVLSMDQNQLITNLITDSRKGSNVEGSVFFAIKGPHHDGHLYIKDLYNQGIRQFVIECEIAGLSTLAGCNILLVESSIHAIQAIASAHRSNYNIPVVGITGSNGKTIIKEWLYQLLSPDYKIAKNPGSYNSQLGVPLSVWQLQPYHQLGLFEAGISEPAEMEKLAKIIQPTVGIFSNLGSAHDEGFESRKQKAEEKFKLFENSTIVIYCKDHLLIDEVAVRSNKKLLSWGFSNNADIIIRKDGNYFLISYQNEQERITIPFTDSASVENCLHCVALLIYLKFDLKEINNRIAMLRSIPMRLELKEGINQCQIIDDTYNNDLAGLQISTEFLANQHQKKTKRIILSDVLQSGLPDEDLVKKIAEVIARRKVDFFVGIGELLSKHKKYFPSSSTFFESTEAFLTDFDETKLQNEIILVKGARPFQFEKIVNKLQRKVHGTVMEIDLNAVVHNLNFFKSRIKPSTKIMVMVKAFAYGSGSTEIANLLQFHKVDYLGVAYADEGIELRKNNISLPIMVMNPSEDSFNKLIGHHLEPEIYSFKIFHSYLNFLDGRESTIHLKLDTGMHRLGFDEGDIEELKGLLIKHQNITVASIFSHLAGADEAMHDQFSKQQGEKFFRLANDVSSILPAKPLYHLLNSPGILRLPEMQFDMVRLGIGLYGVDPTQERIGALKPVATLKTFISQIKTIPAGESIGYGRRGNAEKEMRIATIAIGYADGFSRAFSRGIGKVLINGKMASVVGNVCMDMTMVDVTGIDAREGDEVIIFGKEFSIHDVANRINTIPYEILTSTSERVKRVFVAEGI